MKAEIVAMTAEAIDKEAIARGGEILKRGGLVAFPTETVYGLGGNALDPMASNPKPVDSLCWKSDQTAFF